MKHKPGPWDKPVDHMNPPDRNAPPAGLTNDELETSNYYRTGTPKDFLIFWSLAIAGSIGFWVFVFWTIFGEG